MADRNNQWFEHLIDGETVDSVNTLCERINHFFVNLTKDFTPLSQDDVSNYSAGDSGIADDLLASTGEVYKSLCSLKTGKAPGPDGIPNVILKTFAFDDDLERVQKRALAIIYPNCSYDDALKLAGIEPLVLRRDAACKRFVETILPGNPLYPIVHSRSAPVNHGYKLRSDNVARNIRMRTDRFQKFVTIKYAT
ncbi:Hypothetical predicted protein [Paramuricea clavata]|uniref:Uncharacterized protein n=1 Tax=Paramuricea clavata TaxID=317549 RepID=A0A7D9L8H5_PARCT|nr:Hypothetical predicted protein [Paramuricea clavata]